MSRPNSNVLRFPTESSNGNSLKWFAVIFYAFLAYTLSQVLDLQEDGLGLLMMLGVLYNFFVRQRLGQAYFKQNAVLLVILLVLTLLVYKTTVLLLLGLAVAYWLLVGRSRREAPYFLRFHLLTALILDFFLLMPYLILNAVLSFVSLVLQLAHISVVSSFWPLYNHYAPWVITGLFAGSALWLSINALMGRTPYIGLVTKNVRSWA